MIIHIAYKNAFKVIEKASTKNGLYASGDPKSYNSVWARDAVISLLGPSLVGFKEVFKNSLITLAKYQDELGQIPSNIDVFKRRKKEISFASIDSTLWYIIGHYIYFQHYKDGSLLKRFRKSIDKAFLWLKYQDTGKDGMPEQHPTSDWQDASPHKYGHCINTQALYYAALKLAGKNKEARKLKRKVNRDLWNENYGFYLPYRWKNHREYEEKGRWFDSLGNLLAIFFELADKKKGERILNHIIENHIDKPYPVKNIFPPIYPGDPDWKDYYWADSAGEPTKYLNGGIWPVNGGFYVTCLALMNKKTEAIQQLYKLAEANKLGIEKEWEFHEWIDWKGKPQGASYQSWSAGTYILAYLTLKKKKYI